jgi:hypothetical protein
VPFVHFRLARDWLEKRNLFSSIPTGFAYSFDLVIKGKQHQH